MTQLLVKTETLRRLESITGKHIIRGGDRIINEALDIMQTKIKELEKCNN